MSKISLLDCTLRDGGYINDWKFGQKNLVRIFERLVDAGVDIIEIGFLDDRRPFDIDRSIMPDTASADAIYGKLDKKHSMIIGMIDYGTCKIENITPAAESYLDGIRVIFKKHLKEPALEYCRQLKELGYKVFAQLVSITSYNDEDLMKLIELVNDVKPYTVSIVDTYGLLHPDDLLHYYNILDKYVDKNVTIGFHPHNNFQLAYANALTFLAKEGTHDIVVDGTLFGMGKSAGNAPIELLGMRLNERYGKNYNINSMLEAIEESILNIYETSPWGYKEFFYLSGLNKCHPNYVSLFEGKQNLSTSKINNLLSKIEPEEKKLLYDKTIGEDLYNAYLDAEGSDIIDKNNLKEELKGKSILLVGPGRNIVLQKNKVDKFIKEESPYVISINYIPEDIDTNCIFLTNKKRYYDMVLDIKQPKNKNIKIIATSNVESCNAIFDFVVNRAPLLEMDEKILDNSFLMLVKLLQSISISEVYCAGFDGYSDKDDNYCNPTMEYSFIKKEASNLNKHIKDKISELRNDMSIKFITYSAYDVEEDINGASI